MPKKPNKQLTDLELEIMQLIWSLGECTIREVYESLPKNKDLAYTTVATMVKILEQKGAVKSQKADRTLKVKPILTRDQYEVASVKHLNKSVFRGNTGSMATRLLSTSDLSIDELKSLRKLLDERIES